MVKLRIRFQDMYCLIRFRVQFCSGLVDLVECVGHHRSGAHRLALAGERFVGRLAEDVAEVSDRDVEFGGRYVLNGLSAKPAMVAAAL